MRREAKRPLRIVYTEHVAAVYGFFAYSVAPAVAEDLTADTFERVVRSWRSYNPSRASERTWILAIARNLLRDWYRRQAHRNAASIDAEPALVDEALRLPDPSERLLDADEVRGWLSVLGPREREILALRYAADLAVADIARLVELTPANVHQILSRSMKRLRDVVPEDARPQPQRTTGRSRIA